MNCDVFVCLHMQTDCLKNKLFGARSWFVKMKYVFLQGMILQSKTGMKL